MKQLNFEVRIRFDLIVVKIDDILQANSESGGIKLRIGLFFRCDTDAQVAGCIHLDLVIIDVEFFLIIQHRYDIFKAVVQHINDIGLILEGFEAIAYHGHVFTQRTLFLERIDHWHIESRRGLEVDIVFQSFFHNVFKVGAFSTIAVFIAAAIVVFDDSLLEKQFGLLYLFRYHGQVSETQGCAVRLDHFH